MISQQKWQGVADTRKWQLIITKPDFLLPSPGALLTWKGRQAWVSKLSSCCLKKGDVSQAQKGWYFSGSKRDLLLAQKWTYFPQLLAQKGPHFPGPNSSTFPTITWLKKGYIYYNLLPFFSTISVNCNCNYLKLFIKLVYIFTCLLWLLTMTTIKEKG